MFKRRIPPPPGLSAEEDAALGAHLEAGDHHYRAFVGPPTSFDLIAGIQFSLLVAAGLRETHHLLDVGCGSLRVGRLLIPYLRKGRYFGLEPERWLVEEGIERELGGDIIRVKEPRFRYVEDFSATQFGVRFDYAIAQSVFSHTYPDLASAGLRGIASAMAPDGIVLATFVEDRHDRGGAEGGGWAYPRNVPYTWERLEGLVVAAGMVARRLDWMHPKQQWFAAALPQAEAEIEDLASRLRQPLADEGQPRKGEAPGEGKAREGKARKEKARREGKARKEKPPREGKVSGVAKRAREPKPHREAEQPRTDRQRGKGEGIVDSNLTDADTQDPAPRPSDDGDRDLPSIP